MSTTLRSGPRPEAPNLPGGRVEVQPPPQIRPDEGAAGVLMNAIPMLGSLGAIALVATMGGSNRVRGLMAAGMFLFATLGFVAVQVDRQRRQRGARVGGSRTDYLRHLGTVRAAAREGAAQQRRALTWHHPTPAALPALALERSRLWERGSGHPAYLHVRHGSSPQASSLELVAPEDPPGDRVDPASASALHRLLAAHRVQPDLPACTDLRAVGRIEVGGDEDAARSLARAMVCSAAAFHGPDDLVVAVLCSEQHLGHWDWVKWLPHARSARERDAAGPRRMVSTSPHELAALLPADLPDRPRTASDLACATPHVLLVVDDGQLPPDSHLGAPDGLPGVTLLDLPAHRGDPRDECLRLEVDGPGGRAGGSPGLVLHPREEPVHAVLDQCATAVAEAFARRVAPLGSTRATGASGGGDAAALVVDHAALLGLGDVHAFDPSHAWRSRSEHDRLRVPVGLDDDGHPVQLDLKESAQHGMGPHGLVIGATGSGKSEFLRALVLGLATTHSPEQLNLVLVDFKGGATFAGLAGVPHVSAVITNLESELALVDRMQDALSGEMVRRQELLRRAGNHASLRDYDRARAAGADLPPLPSLLVVVDEFSEMLAAEPEFIDLFVAIGRVGRSLGIHLLLASQRLEEGRLRGLESHLSYRVGLRTFSAAESRTVIGVPDAHELPAVPGIGFLRSDPSTLQRFRSAYVSGPAGPPPHQRPDERGRTAGIRPFTVEEVPLTAEPEAASVRTGSEAAPRDHEGPSLLDVAVSRMQGHHLTAHRVWLPPLDAPPSLGELMPDLVADPDLGLVSPTWRARGGLVVPLGTVDRPREQRRDTLTLDLGGAAGHVAVVGGPRSGKSTLLRTLVASAALTRSPQEVQFFVLDFGGGTFVPMAGLPHLAGIASRAEPDVVRRVVAEVAGVLERREAHFREHGIDTIETYRSRRRGGQAGDGWGDVFLVVDGWSTLRADFDGLELELQQLAGRGLAFGIHVVVAANRWTDLRPSVRDLFGSRLELRLGDPLDSEVDRRLSSTVPADRPGRGLLTSGLHFLGALPRVDGHRVASTIGEGVDDLVARTADAWRGPAGPKLRLLPTRIDLDRVRHDALPGDLPVRRMLLGIDERDLAPVGLDTAAEPHLLVLGEGRSGKSALLRTYLQEVMRSHSAREAQVVLVDYRRSLLGEVPQEYLLDHLTDADRATPALADLATYLRARIPGPEVTPSQLRSRSWWSGAEVFVVVDDHDLVATHQSSPLLALQPLLAQARDVGLHLVVARRAGGASRALHEPVIQSLRDLAMPGLLLSGPVDEGPLIGNLRPAPAPPGRARLVTRGGGTQVVQLAWTDPTT